MATVYTIDPVGGSGKERTLASVDDIDLGADNTLNAADLVGTAYEGADLFSLNILDKDGIARELTGLDVNGTIYYISTNGSDVNNVQFNDNALSQPQGTGGYADLNDVTGVPCFTRGTMIRTQSGDVAIEDLRIGDMVATADSGMQPVRWIGSTRRVAMQGEQPIRIKQGALGPMNPSRDLIVSPHHRMVVSGWRAEVLFGQDEVLVAAVDLVNDDTIRPATDLAEVEYFHMLFDKHEIVIANGAPSESFHPGEVALDKFGQAVREEIFRLFPELEADAKAYGCAARMTVRGREARAITV